MNPKTIKDFLDNFDREFCNNHNRKIRFLRGAFIDEEDQIITIKNFLSSSLLSLLDEVEKKVDKLSYQKATDIFEMGFNNGIQEVINILSELRSGK